MLRSFASHDVSRGKKKCCGRLIRLYLIFSWAGQILWAGKAEKGAVTFPRMTTYGEDSRSGHFSFHFLKGEAGYPGLGLQLSPFLATGGP